MLIIILLILIPLLVVVMSSLFKGNNYLLWGLSGIIYLSICISINKTNQIFMIALAEGLGIIIYAIGILYNVLKKKKGSH
jgi:hypothetical protein